MEDEIKALEENIELLEDKIIGLEKANKNLKDKLYQIEMNEYKSRANQKVSPPQDAYRSYYTFESGGSGGASGIFSGQTSAEQQSGLTSQLQNNDQADQAVNQQEGAFASAIRHLTNQF